MSGCSQSLFRRHQKSFDQIYRDLCEWEGKIDPRFPLRDIDHFDWKRGKWGDGYYSYFYKRFTTHTLSKLRLEEGQKVLVVGCGFGFDEKNIKTLYPSCELWSIDISVEMLKRATKGQSPSRFALSLAEQLPFPDHCFDRLLAREVIEHVIDPRMMIQEIGRVLKRGGRALITTENPDTLSPPCYYDSRIRWRLSRFFGGTVPEALYKNEVPSMGKMKKYTEEAGLILRECFLDGGLYQYLPELAFLFRDRMPRIAHYFSCLENHRKFSLLLCDQVKYVLTSEDVQKDGEIYEDEVYYACPLCRTKLSLNPTGYVCPRCDRRFSLIENNPNFVTEGRVFEDESLHCQDEATKGRPFDSRWQRMAFGLANRVSRVLYVWGYLIFAFLVSLFVEKNDVQMSHILARDDCFQQYLEIKRVR